MKAQKFLKQHAERVNLVLYQSLPGTLKQPRELHKAMHYAVFNGGKRLRSSLVYAVGEALGANSKVLDKVCASIELIHASSLVHDDLPAIDNDNLRRGKPSCHIKFSEATAILAGDALLALAFECLANINKRSLAPIINLKMLKILTHYVGSCGMMGGEAIDVAVTDQNISLHKLATIYKLKTSYLICASIMLGALAAGCTKKNILNSLEKFGLYLGLAFQIHDDIIDIESDTAILGKPQGSDIAKHKPTYPQLVGLEKARQKEKNCLSQAMHYLKKSHIQCEILKDISAMIIMRKF